MTKKKTLAKKSPRQRKAKQATRPAPAESPVNRGVLLSIRQASEEFECDRTALTKKIRDAGLLPAAGGEQYRLRDLLRVHRSGADGKADPNKMTPFERQAHYRAEAECMRVDLERGRLLRAEDVETEWARVLKAIAHELDLVVDEIERDVGASAAVLEKIEAKLDVIRQRMYNRIVDDTGAIPAAA